MDTVKMISSALVFSVAWFGINSACLGQTAQGVSAKGSRVVQDGAIDNPSEQKDTIYPDIVVGESNVTVTFVLKPPGDSSFSPFTKEEKHKPILYKKFNYTDFAIDPDFLPCVTEIFESGQITIVMIVEKDKFGQLPTQFEGNLSGGQGGEGQGGGNHWSIELSQKVDIDIDSNNDDGFDPPQRDSVEETIEDDSSKPGRLIAANDYDIDRDGIPDYADGYGLNDLPNSDTCKKSSFVPIVLELPSNYDIKSTQLILDYKGSDPLQVTVSYDETGPVFHLPDDGARLRIWDRDGKARRNGATLQDGGNYVAPGTYTPKELGFTNNKRIITLFVEGVRLSNSMADERIVFKAKSANSGAAQEDAVRCTVISLKVRQGDVDTESGRGMNGGPAEVLTDINEPLFNSEPAPAVSIDNCQISNINMNQDGRLAANVIVSGSITFAWADFFEDGTADMTEGNASVAINISGYSYNAIVTPQIEPPDFLRPCAKSFRYFANLNNVPIQQPNNLIQINATDPILGNTGWATRRFVISPTRPVAEVDDIGWRGSYAEVWINGPWTASDEGYTANNYPGPYYPKVLQLFGPDEALQYLADNKFEISAFEDDNTFSIVKAYGLYFAANAPASAPATAPGKDKAGVFDAIAKSREIHGNLKNEQSLGGGIVLIGAKNSPGFTFNSKLVSSALVLPKKQLAEGTIEIIKIVPTFIDKLIEIAENRRKDRFAQEIAGAGNPPGSTYFPDYPTLDNTKDPRSVFAKYMWDNFMKPFSTNGTIDNDGRKRAIANMADHVTTQIVGGVFPQASNKLWHAADEGDTIIINGVAKNIPTLTRLQGGGKKGYTLGSKYMLGHWQSKLDTSSGDEDFECQTQNWSQILHFNAGMGWGEIDKKKGNVKHLVETLRDILREELPGDQADQDNKRIENIIAWYVDNDLADEQIIKDLEAKNVPPDQIQQQLSKKKKELKSSYKSTWFYITTNKVVKARWQETVDVIIISDRMSGPQADIKSLDAFVAYEVASGEGFHVFGLDPFNDIIATQSGVLFAKILLLKKNSPIGKEDDVLPQLEDCCLKSRQQFIKQKVFDYPNSRRVTIESFYSLHSAIDKANKQYATVVLNNGPSLLYKNKVIWASTISRMFWDNRDKWKDDNDKNDKKNDFIAKLAEYVGDVKHWPKANSVNSDVVFNGPNGEKLRVYQVRVLYEAIEMLMFLTELPNNK